MDRTLSRFLARAIFFATLPLSERQVQVTGHILHGKVRVTIWRVRVMWVTLWYLTMNYLIKWLPSWKRRAKVALDLSLDVKFVIAIINPSGPNSDQHQLSPCNINTYPTPEVMRIKYMITQSGSY